MPTKANALETSLLFDVFALNESVGRLLSEAMAGGPLTPSEYAVYSAIFELEAATPTQLAARLGMRLTTFSDQLRGIEARGHARRLAHPSDGRSYRVTLTAAGLAAHRAANALFEPRVVADAILQLQANWMADYRNTNGIVLDDGLGGVTVAIEDSTRVDPWIAQQAQRLAETCRETLAEFSRRDRAARGG